MGKVFILLFTVMFLLCSYSFLWAAPGDPVLIWTKPAMINDAVLIGVRGKTPGTVLLMPSGSQYCVHGTGIGLGMQKAENGECPLGFKLISNKYVTIKTLTRDEDFIPEDLISNDITVKRLK